MKQNLLHTYLFITALIGALTIALGAFGAHSLKESLNPEQLGNFETAVRYQMYHVIVLLFVQTIAPLTLKSKKLISGLFYAGLICFSGSIYAITFGVPAELIWFVTPFGGTLLIAGWVFMAFKILKIK
jgi:uncharacterized membrane protein YgdD (TMEM256/DUF423 family)